MARKRSAFQPYIVEKLNNFSGGLNTEDPVTIESNDLAKATNIEYTASGRVKIKPGSARRFSSDFSINPVVGMVPYYKSDGTPRLVMATSTALYVDNPRLTFSYTAMSDWNQVGAYTNLDINVDGVRLKTPPTATFLGTAAYDTMWI